MSPAFYDDPDDPLAEKLPLVGEGCVDVNVN